MAPIIWPLRKSRRPALRRPAGRLALVALCAIAGGCADAPTYPAALQWLADGEDWIAVLPPSSLPTTAEWVRFAGGGASGAAVAERIAGMEAEGVVALTRGDVGTAARLRTDGAILLSRSLERAPDRQIIEGALGAIELWTSRVELNVRLAEAPTLSAAVDSITAARGEAVKALAAGDSLGAARSLIDAGERIRGWSPTIVAVRVLERAEARVAARSGGGMAALRAEHLVRSARDALLAGDPARAMQRAIYALQLAGGQQLPDPPAAAR